MKETKKTRECRVKELIENMYFDRVDIHRSHVFRLTWQMNGKMSSQSWPDIGISFSDTEGPQALLFEISNLNQVTLAEGWCLPEEILQPALTYLDLGITLMNKKSRLSRLINTKWEPARLYYEIRRFEGDIASFYEICHFMEFLNQRAIDERKNP